jgi:hypothetical protein
MNPLFRNLSRIARSPQGRKMMSEAQRLARDPETRRKITEAGRRLQQRRRPR